ncbi:hypothetical protein Ancab_013232 [Ancistrocladus abbreviatus]
MSEERMGTSFWRGEADASTKNVTFPKFTLPFSTYSPKPTLFSSFRVSNSLFTTVRLRRHHHHTNSIISRNGKTFISQFSPNELRRNSCESSVKPFKGRTAQPSSTTREGHRWTSPAAHTCNIIRNILPQHELDGMFATGGYTHATGQVRVSIFTSSPSTTSLMLGLCDALLDFSPLSLSLARSSTG